MNEIGLLEDKEDAFINDVANKLRQKGYPVEFMELNYQEIPVNYKYRIIIDRISFQDIYLRTMIKNFSLRGTYVINNPFTNLCDDKITEYNICQKLGVPYPKTFVLPRENIDVDTSEEIKIPQLDSEEMTLRFPVVIYNKNILTGISVVWFKNNRKS
jgi:glutathione synthase/RimK-type ligase-like ATP-grasp enzyme